MDLLLDCDSPGATACHMCRAALTTNSSIFVGFSPHRSSSTDWHAKEESQVLPCAVEISRGSVEYYSTRPVLVERLQAVSVLQMNASLFLHKLRFECERLVKKTMKVYE